VVKHHTLFRDTTGRWRPLAGPAVPVLLLVIAGSAPLVGLQRFYFRGDTQIAYYPWWYHLGERVREGHIPLIEPLAWEAGNYVAEGQWGLFSPLTMLIGVLATVAPNLVIYVTLLKVGLIVIGGLGTYLVARDYGAREPFALVAGLVVGLSAQSVYFDWPSWANGQIGVALLPWAWWSIRRTMAGRNPAPAVVLCYLVVSVGYAFSALYLAVVLLGCLVEAVLSRSRRQVLSVVALGAISGLVTVAVFLPGVLTSPVTRKDSRAIVWEGTWTLRPLDLLISMVPTPRRHYLLWLLPVLAWLDLTRLRRSARDLAGPFVATLLLTLWVLGPAAVGPVRWPARVQPALMVPLVVLLAVVASRCLPARVSPLRLGLSLAWVCAAAVVIVARQPRTLTQAALGATLVVLALAVTAWSLRHRGARTTTGVVLVSTLVVLFSQLAVSPVPGSADRHMPSTLAEYDGRIPSAWGDVMVLGDAVRRIHKQPRVADDLLVGASWYLDPKDVQHGYTTISFRKFQEKFCRAFNGPTCTRTLPALLSREPTTGRQWVDLLSISTLVLFRPSFRTTDLMSPPAGWSVTSVTRYTVVWRRDERLPSAGGVVATSAGSSVTQERVTDREVRLRVDAVGPQGGTVTLSRLAWPGYSVSGGTLMAPIEGFLLRVGLPAGSTGSTVTVRWDPPGWTLERWALSTAVLGGAAWASSRCSARDADGRRRPHPREAGGRPISRGWRRRRPRGRTGPGRQAPRRDRPASPGRRARAARRRRCRPWRCRRAW
jgi:hypothetical protein